jgi:uncharacterized protein DUF3606
VVHELIRKSRHTGSFIGRTSRSQLRASARIHASRGGFCLCYRSPTSKVCPLCPCPKNEGRTCDIGHSCRSRKFGKVACRAGFTPVARRYSQPRALSNRGGTLFIARRSLRIHMMVTDGGQFQKKGGAPDRSRISMNEAHEARYWTEALGCSEDELAAAVARVGNLTDAVRHELSRHWGYGTFRLGDKPKIKVLPRRRGRPRKRP